MQQDIPKQFLTVNDVPIIIYTMQAFQNHPEIDVIACVCLEGWENLLNAYAKQFNITKLKHIAKGGANGHASTFNGLLELEKYYGADDVVLIHDGNRPLTSAEIISDCIEKTKLYGCAVAAIPCVTPIIETNDNLSSVASHPRDKLKRTQTPQGFFLKDVLNLNRQALSKEITNSVGMCTLAIEMGKKIYFSLGSEKNFKITTVEDIEIFKALLNTERPKYLK